MMKKENRKKLMMKWVEALRSKKYKQGRSRLCQIDLNGKNLYCCLGVLCEIAKLKKEGGGYVYGSDEWDNTCLPPSYSELIGLKKIFDENSEEDIEEKLINLNDTKKASFAKIATWIEKNIIEAM